MAFVVTANNLLSEEITQASVYLDACFILAALNIEDHRNDKVLDILDHLSEKSISWVTNSHVTQEVVSNLFKIKLLRALQVYHEYITTPQSYRRLTPDQNNEIIHYPAAKAIYEQAKAKGFITIRGKRAICDCYEVVKFIKKLTRERRLLSHFYSSAEKTYREFKEQLLAYGFTINHSPIDQSVEDLALAYTHLFQVDLPDALHLAAARLNESDLFLTLDGDYEVGNYSAEHSENNVAQSEQSELKELVIRIFKVA